MTDLEFRVEQLASECQRLRDYVERQATCPYCGGVEACVVHCEMFVSVIRDHVNEAREILKKQKYYASLSSKWEAWTDGFTSSYTVTGPSAACAFLATRAVADYKFTQIIALNRTVVAIVFGGTREESDAIAEHIVGMHNS